MKIKLSLLSLLLTIVLFSCNDEEVLTEENEIPIEMIDIRDLNYDWLDEIDPEIANEIRSRLAWLNDDAQTRALGFPPGVTSAFMSGMDSYLASEGHEGFILTLNGTDDTTVTIRFILWDTDLTDDIIFYEDSDIISSGLVFAPTQTINPAYYWWENDRRIIALQMSTGNDWYEVAYYYQQPILPQEKFTSDLYTTYGGVIPKNGGDITVTLPAGVYQLPLGSLDSLHFRVFSDSIGEIDLGYVEGMNYLGAARTVTLSIPELTNSDTPMLFKLQWKYVFAGSDINHITNSYLKDWEWMDRETGFQQNETFHYVVSEARIIDMIPAHADTIRVYLKKGENSADLSEIDFRANTTFHLSGIYPLPYSTDSVKGVDDPTALSGYDGYVDIAIPVVTNQNGWASGMTSIYPDSHIGSLIAYMAKWDFEYYTGSEWLELTYQHQIPYFLSAAYSSFYSSELTSTGGGTIVLNIAGWWPANQVLFKAASLDESQTYAPATQPSEMSLSTVKTGQVEFAIGPQAANTAIYFFYTIDGGSTWELWDASNPSPSNWILPSTYPLIVQP